MRMDRRFLSEGTNQWKKTADRLPVSANGCAAYTYFALNPRCHSLSIARTVSLTVILGTKKKEKR